MANVGDVSPYKLDATGTFDGWGYMSMYSTSPDGDGKLPLEDAYAIPEALNPDYASRLRRPHGPRAGRGSDRSAELFLVLRGRSARVLVRGRQITPQGAFIDQEGNNFWGVEQFTAANDERLIAARPRSTASTSSGLHGPVRGQGDAAGDRRPSRRGRRRALHEPAAVTAGKALVGTSSVSRSPARRVRTLSTPRPATTASTASAATTTCAVARASTPSTATRATTASGATRAAATSVAAAATTGDRWLRPRHAVRQHRPRPPLRRRRQRLAVRRVRQRPHHRWQGQERHRGRHRQRPDLRQERPHRPHRLRLRQGRRRLPRSQRQADELREEGVVKKKKSKK